MVILIVGPLPRRSSAEVLQDGASPNLKSSTVRKDSLLSEGTANDGSIDPIPGKSLTSDDDKF